MEIISKNVCSLRDECECLINTIFSPQIFLQAVFIRIDLLKKTSQKAATTNFLTAGLMRRIYPENVVEIPNPITEQFGLFHLQWSGSHDLSKRLIGTNGGPKMPSGGP